MILFHRYLFSTHFKVFLKVVKVCIYGILNSPMVLYGTMAAGSQAKAKLKAAAPKKSILAQSAYAYSYLRYVHTK